MLKIHENSQMKALGKSERFNTWLSTATSQLSDVDLKELDGECPLLLHPREVGRVQLKMRTTWKPHDTRMRNSVWLEEDIWR